MSKQITRNIKVQIVEPGMIYSSYKTMAAKMKLRNFKSVVRGARAPRDKHGVLITVKPHECASILLAGVRLDCGEDIIIDIKGLKFI